jgi:hypothetical protein
MQAKINFLELEVCLPIASALPVDRSGDFGRSPFFGQLSGKRPPASTHSLVVLKSKHKGAWKFNLHWTALLLLLTHRQLPQAKAIAPDKRPAPYFV